MAVKNAKKTTTVKAVNNQAITKIKTAATAIKNIPMLGGIVAEFIGSFLLVATFLEVQASPLFVAFALAGVVLMVSGAVSVHLNPATTIGALVTKKISAITALCYVLAQILGGLIAWLTINAFIQATTTSTLTGGTTIFHAAALTSGREWTVFFTELIGTVMVAFGFSAALRAKKDKLSAAFAYGFATLVAMIFVGSITSMLLTESNTGLSFLNPAIAIAANTLSWNVWPIAIYIVAPVLGGVIGVVIHDFIQSQHTELE
jgi:glycerol uptake facilitator-like aquaporin